VTQAELSWQSLVEASGWNLRVALPDGEVFERAFAAGE
jgi:hypothetical protein